MEDVKNPVRNLAGLETRVEDTEVDTTKGLDLKIDGLDSDSYLKIHNSRYYNRLAEVARQDGKVVASYALKALSALSTPITSQTLRSVLNGAKTFFKDKRKMAVAGTVGLALLGYLTYEPVQTKTANAAQEQTAIQKTNVNECNSSDELLQKNKNLGLIHHIPNDDTYRFEGDLGGNSVYFDTIRRPVQYGKLYLSGRFAGYDPVRYAQLSNLIVAVPTQNSDRKKLIQYLDLDNDGVLERIDIGEMYMPRDMSIREAITKGDYYIEVCYPECVDKLNGDEIKVDVIPPHNIISSHSWNKNCAINNAVFEDGQRQYADYLDRILEHKKNKAAEGINSFAQKK